MMQSNLIKLLERHWLFGCLTAAEIKYTAKGLRSKTYQPGEYVFYQGDDSRHLYIVVSGETSVEVISENGQATILASLFQNEIFGEFALIDGKPRSASARARAATEIAYLDKTDFLTLIETNPEFSLRLASGLVARLRGSNGQIESLSTKPLGMRVLSALLELCKGQGDSFVKITQSQLAQKVSGSREKVNVNLKAFEKQGFITISRGRIEIHDIPRMEQWLRAENALY